jgi:hypothetical protein
MIHEELSGGIIGAAMVKRNGTTWYNIGANVLQDR